VKGFKARAIALAFGLLFILANINSLNFFIKTLSEYLNISRYFVIIFFTQFSFFYSFIQLNMV